MLQNGRMVALFLAALLLLTPVFAFGQAPDGGQEVAPPVEAVDGTQVAEPSTDAGATALPSPTILSPVHNQAFGPNDTITVSWAAVSGAESYTLMVLDDATRQVVINHAYITYRSVTLSGGVLPANRRYVVWVYAQRLSTGESSPVSEIKIDVTMERPQITNIQSGQNLPLGDIEVQWARVEGAYYYQVAVKDSYGALVDSATDRVSEWYEIRGDLLELGKPYQVVVTAVPYPISGGGSGPGKESYPVWFNTVLGTPTIQWPSDGQAVTNDAIDITWSAVQGVTGYEVDVDGVRVCQPIQNSCTIYRWNYTPGTMHSLKVAAVAYSVTPPVRTEATSQFGIRLLAPELAGSIPSPFPQGPLTLNWQAVTGATHYVVRLYEGATLLVEHTPTTPGAVISRELLQPGHTYQLYLRSIAADDRTSSTALWLTLNVTDPVFQVTGQVAAQGLAAGETVTVSLLNSAGQAVSTQSAGASGFTLTVPTAGSYTVRAERDGWLKAEVPVTVSSTAPGLNVGQIQLWFGDINRDGRIDTADVSTYADAYGHAPADRAWDVAGGDGLVDLRDLAVVARNVGR